MGTRSTTHFIEGGETVAIVFRHWDGYPKVAGRDLCKFITLCKNKLKRSEGGSRLNDPSYLAAKYVVYLAEIFAADGMFKAPDGKLHKHIPLGVTDATPFEYVRVPRKNRLDFLSVGIVMADPSDIEYRYTVTCDKIDPKTGRPEVKCFKVNMDDFGNDKTREEMPIPGYTKVAPVVETWDEVRTVPSRSKHNKTYVIERNNATMALRCSCPDFKFRCKNGGTCKHIDSIPVRTRYTVSARFDVAMY
jgi:hypothetical protein